MKKLVCGSIVSGLMGIVLAGGFVCVDLSQPCVVYSNALIQGNGGISDSSVIKIIEPSGTSVLLGSPRAQEILDHGTYNMEVWK